MCVRVCFFLSSERAQRSTPRRTTKPDEFHNASQAPSYSRRGHEYGMQSLERANIRNCPEDSGGASTGWSTRGADYNKYFFCRRVSRRDLSGMSLERRTHAHACPKRKLIQFVVLRIVCCVLFQPAAGIWKTEY